MSELETNSGSDVNESEAPVEASPAVESSTPEPSKEAAEKYVPYERFQEIIQQKNEFSKRLEEYERRHKELESRISAPKREEAPPSDKFLEALEKVDPEFGKSYKELLGLKDVKKELDELKSWKSNYEANQARTAASTTLEKLQSEHKVDKFWHDIHVARLKDMDMGKRISIEELPALYKRLNDETAKYLDTQKRNSLGQYTAAKKADATVPSTSKAPAPKSAPKKFEYSKDPDEAKDQIVKRALEKARAHSEE